MVFFTAKYLCYYFGTPEIGGAVVRGQASANTTEGTAEEIASEIERIRDDVVLHRVRPSGGSAHKDRILTLLAEAVRAGRRQLPRGELVRNLTERYEYQPRPGTNPELAIRKALFDISRLAREWYEAHPEHRFCVLFTTGGRIDVFVNGLPATGADRDDSMLRALASELPQIARNTTGLTSRPFVKVQEAPTLRARLERLFGAELVESASPADLSLVSDLLYAWTAHAIEMAIRAFDGQIIAVELHPTHDIAAWDGALQWLDDAYREYRLRQGEIIRLVVLEDETKRDLVEDNEAWDAWVAHIRSRLVTDEVRVILEPLPEWKDVLSRDLLILSDRLVMEFEREDFPFTCWAHRGRAVISITSAAEAIIRSRDAQNVFRITKPLNPDCFETLRKRLQASLPRTISQVSRRR